jgi:hypothetical protein
LAPLTSDSKQDCIYQNEFQFYDLALTIFAINGLNGFKITIPSSVLNTVFHPFHLAIAANPVFGQPLLNVFNNGIFA